MTQFTVKGAVLKAAQNNETINVNDLTLSIGATRAQILCAMKRLRNEGRIKRIAGEVHFYIKGSVAKSIEFTDPNRRARQKKAQAAHQERMKLLAMPIVTHAQMKSPVSIWAYAAGFA